MNIEIGTKWTKDGGVYEVVDVMTTILEATHEYNRITTGIVWHKDQQGEIHVATELDFTKRVRQK